MIAGGDEGAVEGADHFLSVGVLGKELVNWVRGKYARRCKDVHTLSAW